ncbi:hypothetical protein BX666DRAFT_1842359, partial [Dichotomocladium elegans]
IGRKRRASEDEPMEDPSDPVSHGKLHTIKRNRAAIEKQFPLDKLLATMSKDKLIEAINSLINNHPEVETEVNAFI